MKKVVYLAPIFLLSFLGKGVAASQVEHVSSLDGAVEQMNEASANTQQNMLGKEVVADQTTHISRLDEGLMTSVNESQPDQAAQNKDIVASEPNEVKKSESSQDQAAQNKNTVASEADEVNKAAATHISSLDGNNVENNTKVAQYNTFSVKANVRTATNFTESKVANDNSNQHTIENPNEDQIIVHYVDENGRSIAGLKNYTIDINSAPEGNSTGQFKVPDNRYVLPDPTSDYQLQRDKYIVHHDAVTHTVHHDAVTHTVHHDAVTHTVHHDEVRGGHNVDFGSDDEFYSFYEYDFGNKGKNQAIMSASEAVPVADFKDHVHYLKTEPNGDQWYSIDDSSGFISSNMVGSAGAWLDSEQGHYYSSRTFDIPRRGIYVLVPYEETVVDGPAYDETVVDRPAYDETVVDRPAYDETVVDRPAYDETLGNNVFSDNSKNIKSVIGNTVNVILEHQTKRIDPNNSSLNLDANNQLHLINTSQEQPKQSTANFKVGYLLDLVTNNKIIDTNNAQAINNTKIFTVNPSLPIGYDSLNTKLLTLNL